MSELKNVLLKFKTGIKYVNSVIKYHANNRWAIFITAVVKKQWYFLLDRTLYLEKNDPQAAAAVLKRLRGTDDVDDEIMHLRDEQKANKRVKHLTIKQVGAS